MTPEALPSGTFKTSDLADSAETLGERKRRKARERQARKRERDRAAAAAIRAELPAETADAPEVERPAGPGPIIERRPSTSDGRIAPSPGGYDIPGPGDSSATVVPFAADPESHRARHARLLAEHETPADPEDAPIRVLTSTASTSFVRLDAADLSRAVEMIRDDPALRRAGITAADLAAALSRAEPGSTVDLRPPAPAPC